MILAVSHSLPVLQASPPFDEDLYEEVEKKEKCGVFGVWGTTDASKLAYLGLYAQQHRGQESAGIAVSDGKDVRGHAAMGLVS